MQRRFGGLRNVDPSTGVRAGLQICKQILAQERPLEGAVFFEVGTGRVPVVPIVYWLMGAELTITVDLNRYLKPVLCEELLRYISKNQKAFVALFDQLPDHRPNKLRLERFLSFAESQPTSVDDLLDMCNIDYRAPCDASLSGLSASTVDYHTSYTVLVHIPLPVLSAIMDEGSRILSPKGLFVHRVDYTDHFSHSDKSISAINFLQFTEETWQRLAGNRYMYMNRLRHDDFLTLFQTRGIDLLAVEADQNPKLEVVLNAPDFELALQFKSKSLQTLITTGSWFVAKKIIRQD